MRVLVFLLVLANLLFFVFARGYLGGGDNPDGERLHQQLQPERIVIVSKGEPAAEAAEKPATEAPAPVAKEDAPASQGVAETPVPAASQATDKKGDEKKPEEKKPEEKKNENKKAEEKRAQACLAWPDLPAAEADALVALAKKRYPSLTLSRSVVSAEGGSHWVYIPPLASKADAERKAGELKKLGVTEFFIVTEAGANQYAISLGIFSSEQGAKDQLDSLKAKGVRSAKVGLRGGKTTAVHVEARGDPTQIQGLKDSGTAITATPSACEAKAAKKP
ncbi:SPOR domain-containing protein [Azospira oryzae]|uniref:SPOR domain-containing protein n=1 Tax=Azospira oryzae TaxID=146939 RepID=UPI001966C481|nr:SPOR domain-containing protein [Azospira oryzae]